MIYKYLLVIFLIMALFFSRVVRADNLEIIRKVNSEVHIDIKYKADIDNYGVKEHWCYPSNGFGDCEDFALEKKKRLISRGINIKYLNLLHVRNGNNTTTHIVLLYKGRYVLDNRYPNIRHWYGLPYKLLKIQSDDNKWYTIAEHRGALLPYRPTKPPSGWPAFEKRILTNTN